MSADAGFREVDHTADWRLAVWAPTLEELLREAAAGMYHMVGVQVGTELGATREFQFDGGDREQLLVQYLSELLFVLHTEQLAFQEIEFERDGEKIRRVVGTGDPVAKLDKEIKAVTWHDLRVEETGDGFEARVTFDV